MEHLIANSGIHFITKEIEFNPSEPLLLDNTSVRDKGKGLEIW